MEVFEESIEVNAPVEACYQGWRRFSSFPAVMHNVKAVHQINEKTWHWRLIGPNGNENVWEAVLTNDIPDKRISWRPVDESEVDVWLDIGFQRIHERLTEMTITLSLFPPDNPKAREIEDIYGINRDTVQKNLREFKAMIEARQENPVPIP